MEQLFLCVLSLSLSGALTGMLLLLMRPLTKKYFSQKWNYFIWLLVIARLLIPVQFETGSFDRTLFSGRIESVEEQNKETETAAADKTDLKIQQQAAAISGENTRDSEPDAVSRAPVLCRITESISATPGVIAGTIWLLGTALALFLKVRNYRHFSIGIRRAGEVPADRRINVLLEELTAGLSVKNKPEIRESKEISVPITLGLCKPVIMIPVEERNMADFKLVLHHELIHIKRKDLWYKWLYQILLCIHWFNPVLYLIGRKLNEDCELSCDEAVLADLTQEGKKAYGNMLINAAEKNIGFRSNVPSATFLERKEDLKTRLTGILHYKKQTGFKMLLTVCVSAGMICLSACGSVQIAPDALPFHISGGVEEFIGRRLVTFDKKGEAWQAYDNDELLAGEDINDIEWYYSYKGGSNIECEGMYLNGTNSNLIVYADEDAEIGVDISFDLQSGKLKLIYVAPDGTVELLDDAGDSSRQKVTLAEGRNVFKLAGQGAKVRGLNLTYTGLESRRIRNFYYGEEDEQGDILSEKVMSGDVTKEEVLDNLYYMKEESISMALAKFLERGEALSSDELLDLFIYSDEELSVKYMMQAVQKGKTAFLTPEFLSELMPYLNDEGRTKCLLKYLEEGNTLTYSEFDEISPYLNNDTIKKIDEYLKEMPYHW